MARNRGAFTEIATFADDPYAAPFSGNVVELCPVGALTSTQYRFRGRPWEIQNVPTVCGLCPVGCNVSATTREGKVLRVLSRNHPEIDGGWLCDKGRFAHPHLTAEDRIREPLVRGAAGLEPASWDDALDTVERLLRSADGPRRHRPLRQRDDRAGVRAGPPAARRRRRAHGRAARVDLGGARRLPRAARHRSERRRSCVVVGDEQRRRPRAGGRPVAQAGAAQRRRDRHRRCRADPCRQPPARRLPRSRSSSARVTSSATGCEPPSARC